jgi:hypothetical protein
MIIAAQENDMARQGKKSSSSLSCNNQQTYGIRRRRKRKKKKNRSMMSIISHRTIVTNQIFVFHIERSMSSLHLCLWNDGEILSSMSYEIGPDACIYVIVCNGPGENINLVDLNYTSSFLSLVVVVY